MIGAAELDNGLYAVTAPVIVPEPCTLQPNKLHTVNHFTISNFPLWHYRLGHPSYERLTFLHKLYPFITCLNNTSPCDSCHFAKQKRLPFPTSTSESLHAFDLVHMDIWGPLSVASMFGHRYFLTIVDDKSRYTWLYFLKAKSEVPTLIQNFVTMVKTQFGHVIKCIRSDNGPEFLLTQFYQSLGIMHHKTCVETPQQNGVVERKHQHLLAVGRSLLFQSHLPQRFWHFAIGHAVHLINRIPTPFLHNKTPFEVLYNKPPDYTHLRVFGCLAYASTLLANRKKLDSHARKYIFLGYTNGIKGSLLYNLNIRETFLSRNIIFYEHIFPFSSQPPSSTTSTPPLPSPP